MRSFERIAFRDKDIAIAFIALIAVFFTIYLATLTNYSISIDDERSAWRTNPDVWVRQGRWGIYLIEYFLFPHSVVPFLPHFLFGVSVAVGFVVLCEIFKEPVVAVRSLLLFAVFVSVPTWSFTLEFYGNTIPTGIGFALASVASYQANQLDGGIGFRRSFLNFFFGVVSLTLSISMYQSYILLYFGVAAGVFMHSLLFFDFNSKEAFNKGVHFFSIGFASLIIYYFLWNVFMYLLQVEPAYIDSFFNPDIFIGAPWAVLQSTFAEAIKVYFGDVTVFAHNAWSYAILTLAAFSATILTLLRKGPVYFLGGLFVLIGVVSAPFALNLLTGGNVPYRSLVGVPFAVWLLALCLLRISATAASRKAVITLLLVVLFQNCYSIAIFDANTRLVATHDELLAEQVYQRIVKVSQPLPRGARQRVEFFGAKSFVPPYPRVVSSTAGYSFFEWDGGNPWRIISFLHLLGHNDLTEIDVANRNRLRPEFESMPTWPTEGSVKMSGDTVLVKMGDDPGIVHATVVSEVRSPFFDTAKQGFSGLSFQNAHVARSGSSLTIQTKEDPQIYIDVGPAGRACRSIQINLRMDVPSTAFSQIFFLPSGETSYSEKNSVSRLIAPSDRIVTLYVRSATGFEPKLRLDPTLGLQDIEFNRVTVGCAG